MKQIQLKLIIETKLFTKQLIRNTFITNPTHTYNAKRKKLNQFPMIQHDQTCISLVKTIK